MERNQMFDTSFELQPYRLNGTLIMLPLDPNEPYDFSSIRTSRIESAIAELVEQYDRIASAYASLPDQRERMALCLKQIRYCKDEIRRRKSVLELLSRCHHLGSSK